MRLATVYYPHLMIGPTCVVVPGGDFASAFADLSALEPVASVPFLALDPRCEFFLSCRRRQGRIAQKKARAMSARRLATATAGNLDVEQLCKRPLTGARYPGSVRSRSGR